MIPSKNQELKLYKANIDIYFNSRQFNERRMGSDVNGEILGDEYKGYIFRITGGNDKQGFTMKQGILVNGRVRILMKESKLYSWIFHNLAIYLFH